MAKYMMEFEKSVIQLEEKLESLKKLDTSGKNEFADEIVYLEDQLGKLKKLVYGNLTPWQRILVSRHPERPRALDFINHIFSDFTEVHGDRLYGDDAAVVAGFGHLEKKSYCLIGTQKGKNAKTNVHRNFGMPHPEGYRKAMRVMKTAEKFSLPIISFVDTQGAYPGIGAEERGQASAIANNIVEMINLKVPTIAIDIAEGGSGGALAISASDRLIMLENAYYSVSTPEACASILWHDETKASIAADSLKLTAKDLKGFGLADYIVKEPLGGAHRDPETTFYDTRKIILDCLEDLNKKHPKVQKLIEAREKRVRNFGRIK